MNESARSQRNLGLGNEKNSYDLFPQLIKLTSDSPLLQETICYFYLPVVGGLSELSVVF